MRLLHACYTRTCGDGDDVTVGRETDRADVWTGRGDSLDGIGMGWDGVEWS